MPIQRSGDLFADRSFGNSLNVLLSRNFKFPIEIDISFKVKVEAEWAGQHMFGGTLPSRFTTRITANSRNLPIFREGALGQIDQEISAKVSPFLYKRLAEQNHKKNNYALTRDIVDSSDEDITISDVEIFRVSAEIVQE